MSIKERKRELRKVIKTENNLNSAIILMMINDKKLDHVIESLDNEITPTNTTCLVRKGYLTSEEQFIDVLHHIMFRFNVDFWFLKKYGNTIIETVLCYEDTIPLLLTKKYLGDNNFIPYYELEFKKICIINFYKILKFIDYTEIIQQFLDDYKIDIQNFNINKIQDVDKLYNALRLICLCNCNSYGLLYLFNPLMNEKTKSMYQVQLGYLLENTYELKDLAQELIERIR